MSGSIQNVGVARELASQYCEKIQRIVRSVVGHRAFQAEQADSLLEIVIGQLMDGFPKQGKRLFAMSGLGERDRALGDRLGLRTVYRALPWRLAGGCRGQPE